MSNRYIGLYGYVTKILHQNNNVIFFIFDDEYYGEVYCKAGADNSSYFKEEPNTQFHIRATLEGIPFKTKNGIESVNNQLYVKKVYPLKTKKWRNKNV